VGTYYDFPVAFRASAARNILAGDCRGIWVGDSYSSGWLASRLPHGWLVNGLMMGNRPAAIYVACTPGNQSIAGFTNHTGGTGAFTYTSTSNSWAIGNSHTFGLPLGQVGTLFGGADFTLGDSLGGGWGKAYDCWVDEVQLAAGNTGYLITPSSSVESCYIRPLFYPEPVGGDGPSRWGVHDDDTTNLADMNPRTQGRGYWGDGDPVPGDGTSVKAAAINAYYADINLGKGESKAYFSLRETGFPNGADWLNPAGAVMWRGTGVSTRDPGYYHTVIGDASWSYGGHGADAASTGSEKQYSRQQLQDFLDVTTLDRDQPVCVVLHIADEQVALATIKTRVEAIISVYSTAFDNIGISKYHFLLVGGYMHFDDTGESIETNREFIERNNRALYEVATESGNVSFVSIYAATNGHCFMDDDDGGTPDVPPGTNAASLAWLAANGYDSFTFGGSGVDLTDGDYDGNLTDDGLHIGGSGSADNEVIAAFFAEVVKDSLVAQSSGVRSSGRSGRVDRVSRG